MQRSRTVLVALGAVLAVTGLAACGSGAGVASPTTSAIRSGGSSDGGSVSPGPGGATPPTATATPASSTTPSRPAGTASGHPGCLSGTVDLAYPEAGDPPHAVCVHVGTRILITLRTRPGDPWRAVVSSAPRIVALAGDTVAAGGVHASASAVGAGTAVLSAETRQPVGAAGQLTQRWQLEVTVLP